jgi:hypothetical protein
MRTEPLTSGRTVVSERGAELELVIPAPRKIVTVLFLLVWLGGWVAGEVAVTRRIFFEPTESGGSAFLLVWLAGWTVGGGVAIFSLLWMLFGRERVTLGVSTLTIRREALGVGRERRYDLANVKDLRASPVPVDTTRRSAQPWGFGGGTVAFDYGAQTIRFGAQLEEAEAKQLVARLVAGSSWLRRSVSP